MTPEREQEIRDLASESHAYVATTAITTADVRDLLAVLDQARAERDEAVAKAGEWSEGWTNAEAELQQAEARIAELERELVEAKQDASDWMNERWDKAGMEAQIAELERYKKALNNSDVNRQILVASVAELERERDYQYRRRADALTELQAVAARERRLREALEPFADQYNWHHNYDGHGCIFQRDVSVYGVGDSNYEDAIAAARAALADGEDTNPGADPALDWRLWSEGRARAGGADG